DEEHELARFLAFIEDLLAHDHHEITYFAILVLGEFRDRHFEHREDRVRPVEGQHVELTDDRIAQVLRRRLLGTVQKLFAVDDLQRAAFVGAVAELHAFARRAGRNRPVHLGRHRAGGSGLLSNQAEVTDMNRRRWIAEVEDLGHALYPPAFDAGHEISDASVAFPPALMGVLQPFDDLGHMRCGRANHCSRRAAYSWLPADRRSWGTERVRGA